MRKLAKAAAAALPLLCASLAAGHALAEETVNVASYGGAYQDALRKAFYDPTAKALGITIKDYTLSSIADIRTQVKAGNIEWDVVELYSGQCQQAANEGLLEPLDYKVINADGIPKDVVQPYWVGFTAYSSVLAYNTEVYKDNPPKNWKDFWDTEKFPGTRALGGYGLSTTAEMALMADGVAKDQLYPIDQERAIKKLEEIKPHIVAWWSSGAQSAQLATSGEADMLSIWVARIEAAIKDGAPYAFTYDQAIMDVECLVVPKGAKNKELAMKVINSFISPELQAELPKYVSYGPMNQKAYDTGKISPETAAKANTSPENLSKQVVQNKAYWAENGQKSQEKWDAFLQKGN
ncbi:putative spermidine/putrescine transport system substrate-binding protein [Rhodoligotrophos appendicifer]|uniref:ABC transporter substrate-binding protein n=1 Tax=Rhodoligotrophos appendicifer TaxID=987056 RepID=UPI0011869875|nr:ABC transporter substrate-binding protein [Rhodoligotrophos appendicifer]